MPWWGVMTVVASLLCLLALIHPISKWFIRLFKFVQSQSKKGPETHELMELNTSVSTIDGATPGHAAAETQADNMPHIRTSAAHDIGTRDGELEIEFTGVTARSHGACARNSVLPGNQETEVKQYATNSNATCSNHGTPNIVDLHGPTSTSTDQTASLLPGFPRGMHNNLNPKSYQDAENSSIYHNGQTPATICISRAVTQPPLGI